ncbi:LysR substrate-binding domain-containing protein [Xanthobacter sp. KR7-225]|uniref:LysR substrate-binding domain-containing protein n=1 Tax=Xanthobacter sp. KR7-225 TaxID=3156613 RepID=UPI0032B51CA7
MEIAWLEDFLALSTTLNFSRAAEMRNVTQPTFSRRIQNLEAWLGAPLVDRSTFPVSLTDEGKVFRKTAEDMVQMLYRERDQHRVTSASRRPLLTFATLHTIALSFYPDWIEDVERALGPVRARMICSSLHDCVAQLASGGCDFMLCYFHPSGPLLLNGADFPSLRIARDRLVPVCAPDAAGRPLHGLDGPGGHKVAYLAYAPHTFIIKLIDSVMAGHARPPVLDPVFESALAVALKAMALKGRGVTWLPESAVAGDIAGGQLVYAGGPEWMTTMDVRIYRSAKPGKAEAERLWKRLAGQDRISPI